jgi:hypothetical protein
VAVQEPETHLQVALEYLLNNAEAASRLRNNPVPLRLSFLQELVRQLDPHWDEFVQRYREACGLAQALVQRLQKQAAAPSTGETLQDEIADQDVENPSVITAKLLGRVIENGEWWQYLKELAYQHPASVLFIARQAIRDDEILVPRYRSGSTVPSALRLIDESAPRVADSA